MKPDLNTRGLLPQPRVWKVTPPGDKKITRDYTTSVARTLTFNTLERDMRQCTIACPKHGAQCRLKMFEQDAYPMHGHLVDGKMCVWAK